MAAPAGGGVRPPSTNMSLVATVLNELGVDFEFVPVGLRTGAHKQPDFLELKPFVQIPALQDGDEVLDLLTLSHRSIQPLGIFDFYEILKERRVACHQPVHRHQVQLRGPAAYAVGQVGGVAGGGVAPLLPGGVRAAHQAHSRRPHRRDGGGKKHCQSRQAAGRLRGAPRRRVLRANRRDRGRAFPSNNAGATESKRLDCIF